MRFLFVFFLMTSLLFCSRVMSADTKTPYQVTLDELNGSMVVQGCFEVIPNYLEAGQRKGAEYIKWFKQGQIAKNVTTKRIRLSAQGAPCFSYQVDLHAMLSGRQAWNKDNAWMVNNRAWLWLPSSGHEVELHFSFNTPQPHQEISVPWTPLQQGYLVGNTPNWWTSRMAFGDIYRQNLQIGQQTLRLAILGIESEQQLEQLTQWVAHTAGTVADITGQYPVDNGQALILPMPSRSGPVPWGELQRGGLPSVHLFVNPNHKMQDFYQDWTASHEFSHTLLPKTEYADRWISEGMATYYQYIIMARSGVLTPDVAWDKMRQGLIKGRKASNNHSLRDAKGTKHAYWGGAAFFMLADLALREKNKRLDDVLAALHDCCVPSAKQWQTTDFMKKLDALSQTTIFTELLENEARSRQFPTPKAWEKTNYETLDEGIKSLFKPTPS